MGLPIIIMFSFRKTTGAAEGVGFGLKLNSTVTLEAKHNTSGSPGQVSINLGATTNQAQSGTAYIVIPPRNGSYLAGGVVIYGGGTPGGSMYDATQNVAKDAALPNAEITSVTIRGIVETANITAGADDLYVFSLPTS